MWWWLVFVLVVVVVAAEVVGMVGVVVIVVVELSVIVVVAILVAIKKDPTAPNCIKCGRGGTDVWGLKPEQFISKYPLFLFLLYASVYKGLNYVQFIKV